MSQEADARSARAHALAVLRIRGYALAAALLPAAVAVVLAVGSGTGQLGAGWDGARWTVTALALLVLVPAVSVAAVVAGARPAVSPTVALEEREAPDLYNLVRDLAGRLDVPAPSAVALTPDCDSWLEDRGHPAQQQSAPPPGAPQAGVRRGAGGPAPVLVIGSPFLWWMRTGELRALLAPVVAGTGPAAHPDIAAARRFVRGLDAAVAVADRGRPVTRPVRGFVGWAARRLLRGVGPHAAEMERGVAAAASARAHGVDHGLRARAQEQVGLAYAGWDRLLTRVALPAWRIGRWPAQLDAGVVSALTELSHRDRLADDFTSRLGERPACDLLEEPGAVDERVSLLAAQVCLGVQDFGPHWTPVDWQAYPEEVVDRTWRMETSRLFGALNATEGAPYSPASRSSHEPRHPKQPPPSEALPHATTSPPATDADGAGTGDADTDGAGAADGARPANARAGTDSSDAADASDTGPTGGHAKDGPGVGAAHPGDELCGPTLDRVMDRLAGGAGGPDALAARISAMAAREEAAGVGPLGEPAGPVPGGPDIPEAGGGPPTMGLPLQQPRTGRELLAGHITAAVCCAAVDTAGAAPGLDWLDGPALLLEGERKADLTRPVLDLVEDGDAQPLRDWLAGVGVRSDKPIRLV